MEHVHNWRTVTSTNARVRRFRCAVPGCELWGYWLNRKQMVQPYALKASRVFQEVHDEQQKSG